MLSSFFKTRKPAQYLVCFLIATLFAGYFIVVDPELGWESIWLLPLVLLCIALFQFIALKNELTGNNSYAMWIYTLLSCAALWMMGSVQEFFAFCFYLLALRRLLSLRSGRGLLKKVFDSSLWIAVGVLFLSWTALFYVAVFIGILIYAFKNYRNWTAPFLAAGCVAILAFTYDKMIGTNHFMSAIDGFASLKNIEEWYVDWISTAWVLINVMGIVATLGLLFNIPKVSLSARSKFSILGFIGVCSIGISVLTGCVLFLIPVISVFLSRVVKKTDNKIIREVVLTLPFVALFVLFFQFL